MDGPTVRCSVHFPSNYYKYCRWSAPLSALFVLTPRGRMEIHMKTCIKCGTELDEDYKIKIHNVALLAYITVKKGKNEKELRAAICPQCGNVCFYIVD